jgi:hypothetical protein
MYFSIKQSTSSGKKMMSIFFDVNKKNKGVTGELEWLHEYWEFIKVDFMEQS